MNRIREVLRTTLRESGLAYSQIEAVFNWDRDHVGDLVSGKEPLLLAELLLILDLVRVEPADFWREVYVPHTKKVSGNGGE